ncbi:MAG: hypothetical protein V1820_05075 [archaeon]
MVDFKKIALVAAIAVFLAVFVIAGIDLFVKQPDYADYCRSAERAYPAFGKEGYAINCTALPNGGPTEYADVCGEKRGFVDYRYDSNGCPYEKFCNTCSEEYEAARKQVNFASYIFTAIFGSLAVVAGVVIPEAIEAIASGILYGGMILLVFGTFAYGDLSNKYFRFFSIGFNLILIIWATWRKVESARTNSVGNGKKRKR